MGVDGWVSRRLGAHCSKIGSGATPHGGSQVYLPDGPYALIRSQNIHNDGFRQEGLAYISREHAAKLAHVEVLAGDILINITGDSVARACEVDPGVLPARVNQHVAIIRPDPSRLHARYVRYYLVSPSVQAMLLSWAGAGGTRNALTKAMLESLEVSAPQEVREQQAIARILGALDDKIALNRRLSETLEETARALFKSWFVDYDPVRAKAAGRQPAGLAPEVAALFPDALEDSALGPIPKGWKVATLGSIGQEVRNAARPSDIPANTPYIALEHMPRRSITLDSWGRADGVASSKLRFSRGDILFGKLRPYFHKVGPAPTDGVCSTDIVVARATGQCWYSLLLGHMSSDAFVSYTDRGSTGTKMPRTNWRYMSRYPIVLPDADVSGRHSDIVEAVVLKLHSLVSESHTLAELRDALLPRLISGALRVPDAERIVARAV